MMQPPNSNPIERNPTVIRGLFMPRTMSAIPIKVHRYHRLSFRLEALAFQRTIVIVMGKSVITPTGDKQTIYGIFCNINHAETEQPYKVIA
jgi:hypothetical protein